MTTRAAVAASKASRFVREVTIQNNLCNEPWVKYSMSFVAGKGLNEQPYAYTRLKKGEVLYLETDSCRYELCFAGEKMVTTKDEPSGGTRDGGWRWSQCKRALPEKVMRSFGVPLAAEHVEVLEESLDWEEDVQWLQTGVVIAGKEYSLARVHFLSPNL